MIIMRNLEITINMIFDYEEKIIRGKFRNSSTSTSISIAWGHTAHSYIDHVKHSLWQLETKFLTVQQILLWQFPVSQIGCMLQRRPQTSGETEDLAATHVRCLAEKT